MKESQTSSNPRSVFLTANQTKKVSAEPCVASYAVSEDITGVIVTRHYKMEDGHVVLIAGDRSKIKFIAVQYKSSDIV